MYNVQCIYILHLYYFSFSLENVTVLFYNCNFLSSPIPNLTNTITITITTEEMQSSQTKCLF